MLGTGPAAARSYYSPRRGGLRLTPARWPEASRGSPQPAPGRAIDTPARPQRLRASGPAARPPRRSRSRDPAPSRPRHFPPRSTATSQRCLRPSSPATFRIALPARPALPVLPVGRGQARALRASGTGGRLGRDDSGLGRVRLRNLVTVVPGASPDVIVVVAHRDNIGVGPGANDNASGTAALIELARGYSRLGPIAGRPEPQHTLVFLSSDGGAFGGFGAERFASTSPLRNRVKAVVSLDAIAGTARPRLELAGFAPRSPAPALVRTADVRIAEQAGRQPARPGWLDPARRPRDPVRVRRAGALPRPPDLSAPALHHAGQRGRRSPRRPRPLNRAQFVRLGRAADSILASLDGGIELAGGTAGYVYLGNRIIRGWAIGFVLVVALVPYLVGVDRPLRPRPPAAPAASRRLARVAHTLRRLALGCFASSSASLAGVFPRGSAIPPPPDSPAVTDWPVAGLALVGALAWFGWWRARRVLPRRPLRGRTTSSPGTPSHSSGWGRSLSRRRSSVPTRSSSSCRRSTRGSGCRRSRSGGRGSRMSLFGFGLVGPALAVVVVGTQLGLGLHAPLYLVSLMTLGFISWPTILVLVCWAAVAAQLGALTAGRYAPSSGGLRAPGSAPSSRHRSSPCPLGTCTSASADVVRAIMCDSWPSIGSTTAPSASKPTRLARSRRAPHGDERRLPRPPGLNGGSG